MHLGLEQLVGHGAANQRGGDIVQKAGNHKHHHQQRKAALPVVGQVFGQNHRHMAFFKMPGQDGKAGEQAEQIGHRHPFVVQMPGKTGQTRASHKASDGDFIHADDGKTAQRHPQREVVKQRHAQQGGGKQKELQRDAAYADAIAGQRRHGQREARAQ